MENYSESIKDFMDRLSDEDRIIMDDITDGVYEAGYVDGIENSNVNKTESRTTFGEPIKEDIKDLISLFPEMLDSYNDGVKEALKYAGMVNVLSSVGISIEVLETLIVNMMLVSESDKSEVDIESIIEEEARKY